MNPFRGVIVASVTPFRGNGDVDHTRMQECVQRLVAAGATGVVACGTTGEAAALHRDERAQLVRAAVAGAHTRVPVLAGVAAGSTRDAIDLGRDAAEAGAQGLLAPPPWYSQPTGEELVAHYRELAANVDLPIVLYNYPSRTGVDLTPELVARLAMLPRVVAIKDSSGDISRLARRQCALPVLCGSDDLAFDFFCHGCDGWVSGSANLLPRLHVSLYRHLVGAADLHTGRRLWQELAPLLQLLESGGFYVQSVKAGLAHLGEPVGEPRPPLHQPGADGLEPLLSELTRLRDLEARVTDQERPR